ncbi:hypothetical protein [Nocardia sp. NPDC058480]|uniref:hypothetical protein n=1 Tax=Nocardia sp. NPDC058480 TaxID=3346522 RepID=UPI003657BA72
MSKATTDRLTQLRERAARRSLSIRYAPEPPWEWELSNPWRVVVSGSLDDIEAWLTAAESNGR